MKSCCFYQNCFYQNSVYDIAISRNAWRGKLLNSFKPIFHQKANPLELGWFALLCLRYPPTRAFQVANTNMLGLKSLADPTRTPAFALLCLHYAQREPQCEQVEYGHVCIGFTLGMSISFCFFPFFTCVVTQRKHGFWWYMGFNAIPKHQLFSQNL